MNIYRVIILIDGHFTNYLGDSVYSNEDDAIKEVKRICDSYTDSLGNTIEIINNEWKNVRIVDKNDKTKIIEWFGYETLKVI